mgnify:CR=1 FL=1
MHTLRRHPLALAAAVVVALYAAPAAAAVNVYTANLDAFGENVESDGVGLAIVTLNSASFSMRVQTAFFGLTSPVTVAHIHCCTAVPLTGNAGVATAVPTFPDFPAGGTQGFYDKTFDMLAATSWNPSFVTNNGGSFQSAFAALKSGLDDGRAYLNIHTQQYMPGEIRGYLLNPIPEPGTYALMAAGLVGIGAWVRRRRAAQAASTA